MHSLSQLRILLVGRSGDGMTSTRNTILEHKSSKMKDFQSGPITVVETPGLFDTRVTNAEVQHEMVKCIEKCAPGPHVILIILKVGRYTAQEGRIISEIKELFGEDVLTYSIVLFTNGDQLEDGQTISEFVRQSTGLQHVVDQCGGRVHVIDNKYWNEQQDEYRSNSVQLEKLLNTIEEMVKNNGGKCYSKEMLQTVRKKKAFVGSMRLFENVRRWVKKYNLGRYWTAVVMVSALALSFYYYNH